MNNDMRIALPTAEKLAKALYNNDDSRPMLWDETSDAVRDSYISAAAKNLEAIGRLVPHWTPVPNNTLIKQDTLYRHYFAGIWTETFAQTDFYALDDNYSIALDTVPMSPIEKLAATMGHSVDDINSALDTAGLQLDYAP